MTQEVFFKFAQHFINSLPQNHEPVLLLLDGHGSRWALQALQLLLANKVYCFFIASHTSIWAQPNDCGLNLRFHRCIEYVCKHRRRGKAHTPNAEYFNEIFPDGWRHYMNQEREDPLSENKSNNTTSAYEKTGMYPFDPDCFAWTEAMDNVGLTSSTQRDYKRQVSYEIYANETCGLVELSPDKKKTYATTWISMRILASLIKLWPLSGVIQY